MAEMDQSDYPAGTARRQLNWTRILLLIWLGLGSLLVVLLCYIASFAFRPPAQGPVYVGDVDEFPPNSVNKEFINATFFDETSNKELQTIPLAVVREANGTFTVFFARSTRDSEAVLIPQQCVVDWDDSLAQFLELCGGSIWTREGKYVTGPAPRDLDRFPAHVQEGKLYIDLKLEPGAAH